MKKFREFISMFLVCCILATTTGTSANNVIIGDFNHDGKVTSADAIYLLKHTIDSQNYPLSYGEVEESSEPTSEPTTEPTEEPSSEIKYANVGDIIKLGSYEQDNNIQNGTEDISWQVLAKDGSKMLVISKYCLDAKAYHDETENVTWSDCAIRSWLNEEFINSAFNSDEMDYISKTNVDGTGFDKIFLLSNDEVNAYFSTAEAKKATATAYAKNNGAYTSKSCTLNGNATTCWWTRTAGTSNSCESYVFEDGTVNYAGNGVKSALVCIRPAMWVDTSAGDQYIVDGQSVDVGDTVIFGNYEQDNDTLTGVEEIQWKVLDKSNNSILVVSEYVLDAKPYNEEFQEVTWETCFLRSWLNNEFYNNAFSSHEKNLIRNTTVAAESNPTFDSDAGNDTLDNIFLLSINEVNSYFATDGEKMCEPTEYAVANGLSTYYEPYCEWWLRNLGMSNQYAAYVHGYFLDSEYSETDTVDDCGSSVDDVWVGVRPALWIDLSKDTTGLVTVRKAQLIDKYKKAYVGESVTFGSYEQDNDKTNGNEEIIWKVMEKNETGVLLVSKYALDWQKYNDSPEVVTWETSSIRSWLNSTFLNNAFSVAEQKMIKNADIVAAGNPQSSEVDAGNNTNDKVFLLSIDEVEKYFPDAYDRDCMATEYAIAMGADAGSYSSDCTWLLRSPGCDGRCSATVTCLGSINYYGEEPNSLDWFGSSIAYGVRPALWISFD